MFARNLHLHLKPNSVAEFTRTIEKEVIPLLRKQKGFLDEMTLLAQSGKGWWRLAGSPPATEGMSVAWFESLGLISLTARYEQLTG